MTQPSRPDRSETSVAERKEGLARLLSARGRWVTAADLATDLGVSTRSVRAYIAELVRSGAAIESGPMGYRSGGGAVVVPSLPPGRAVRDHTIVGLLATSPQGVDVFDLAETLVVSDSTIEHDLVRVRAWLAVRGVRMVRRRSQVCLIGDDHRVRRLLAELIRSEAERTLDLTGALDARFPGLDFGAFARELSDLLTAHGFSVNDYGLANALVHIAVLVGRRTVPVVDPRAEAGADQDSGPGVSEMAGEASLEAAISRLVSTGLGVYLAPDEIVEIAQVLGAHALTGPRRIGPVPEQVGMAVDRIVAVAGERFAAEYGFVLTDGEFLDRTRAHLLNLLERAQRGAFNRNPLTNTMKASYPWVYELAVVLAEEVQHGTGITIPEDEIAFLAFHLGSSIRVDARPDPPVVTCVYAPRYYDMAADVAERLTAATREVSVAEVVEDLQRAEASDCPLLVSTTSVRRKPDAVVVTPFVNREDVKRVTDAVSALRDRRRAEAVRIDLLGLFEEPLFVRTGTLSGPEEAIGLLGGLMVESDVFDADEIPRILDREAMSSTALVDGLAIPHAIGMRARRTAFAVAITDQPIRWTDRPVSVVLMLAPAPGDVASFQAAMEHLTAVLIQPDAVTVLRSRSHDHRSFISALEALLIAASDS